MDLTQCVQTERATRDFVDQPVSEGTIEAVVDHARRAGSGHNRQPWTFVVLTERDRIDTLAGFGNYTTPLRRAPVGIVVTVDDSDSAYRHEHNVFDCGRAAQNLMLAATARKLGTVPQGISEREPAAQFLELPADKDVLIAIAMGYPPSDPDELIEGVDKESELHHLGRKPVDEVLHWEVHR